MKDFWGPVIGWTLMGLFIAGLIIILINVMRVDCIFKEGEMVCLKQNTQIKGQVVERKLEPGKRVIYSVRIINPKTLNVSTTDYNEYELKRGKNY